MNYKYYIAALFFINSFSLHASDTIKKRSSVKEIQVAYAEKTGNPYLIQKQQQQLIHEQFKKDIKIIKEWNDQEGGNNAGSAIGRIAKNIDSLKLLPSYKDFQDLDLSKILTRCNTFKHYSNVPVNGISNLQIILIALAPHNASAFNFYSTVYLKTIVPKQHIIDKPSLSIVDAVADAHEIIKIVNPIATSIPNQISQQPQQLASDNAENLQIILGSTPNNQIFQKTGEMAELKEMPQPTDLTEHQDPLPEQITTPELPQPTPSAIETPQAPVINQQKKQDPAPTFPEKSAQPKPNDASKHKNEKVASTSFYKQLFLGLGGLGTFLLILYCGKHYDKETLINFFTDPQYALTCLRRIVSGMAI